MDVMATPGVTEPRISDAPFPGTRHPAPGTHDVVVIGAGIGGLTAAALAAREGAGVLVLEAHNRPGGCAGDFALGGLLFPAGATLLSGFEAGGLHDLVYRRLGITHRAVALERAMAVVGPEGRFSLWADRARWDEEWRAAFPGHEDAKARFLRWAEELGGAVHRMASRLPVLPPCAPRDLLRLAGALRPEALRSLPYLLRTAGAVLAATGAGADPAFRQFVDAQLLDATGSEADTCAAIGAAVALDLYHRGCFALPGGPAEIARDLVRAVRRDGGVIRYQAQVTGLRRSADRWSVQTADGAMYQARTVIANVPAWDLPALLGGQTPRRLRETLRLRTHGWGAFVLHAAVDAAALPPDEHIHAQTLPPPGGPLAEGGMCFVTVLPPGRRPGVPRAVSVSTHTEAGAWWSLEPAAYDERKAVYAERLLAACEMAFPGFRAGLHFVSAATPRTYTHYTGRSLGLVGGVRNDVHHSLFGAVSHRSGLRALYLCGDTVFPGQGTIGVTLSGINAWRSARDDLARMGLDRGRRPGRAAIVPCA